MGINVFIFDYRGCGDSLRKYLSEKMESDYFLGRSFLFIRQYHHFASGDDDHDLITGNCLDIAN